MLYTAMLIDRFGLVPYRDFFDMNMPGTYFAYYIIGKLSGYTDIGIRYADLLILLAISFVAWLSMRSIGWRVAWCGSVLWGLLYLGFGPAMSLQREYLILLPIAVGTFVYSALPESRIVLRNIILGILFGIVGTMKPHAAIGLPLLVALDFIDTRQNSNYLVPRARIFFKQTILPVCIGMILPILAVVVYLLTVGAMTDFLDIVTNYLPLYAQLSGTHRTLSGLSRLAYILDNYRRFGDLVIWLAPAAIGGFIALYQSELNKTQKRQVVLLTGLAICYSFYPAFTGQFWSYHWLIFFFFVVQVSSLCLVKQSQHRVTGKSLYPIVVLVFAVFVTMPADMYEDYVVGQGLPAPKSGRVDEIAAFLNSRLEASDSVQPLDWTGGAIHAMLISEARIATPFIYDFHFYHHISNQYIQNLRTRFIAEMMAAQPRYIVNIVGNVKPWVSGKNTTREFKELAHLLEEDYVIVSEGNGYLIYESRQVWKDN